MREHFGHWAINLLKPLEFTRNIRHISSAKLFKTTEWRHYAQIAPVLLMHIQNADDAEAENQAMSLLLLSTALAALNKKVKKKILFLII